jgi:hypothetical protein
MAPGKLEITSWAVGALLWVLGAALLTLYALSSADANCNPV